VPVPFCQRLTIHIVASELALSILRNVCGSRELLVILGGPAVLIVTHISVTKDYQLAANLRVAGDINAIVDCGVVAVSPMRGSRDCSQIQDYTPRDYNHAST
jgi:hypothetical protein